jgi:hypothetical protein
LPAMPSPSTLHDVNRIKISISLNINSINEH